MRIFKFLYNCFLFLYNGACKFFSVKKWKCAVNCFVDKVFSVKKWKCAINCLCTQFIPFVIKACSFTIYNLLYFILKALEPEEVESKSDDDIGYALKALTYFVRMIGLIIIWTLITNVFNMAYILLKLYLFIVYVL